MQVIKFVESKRAAKRATCFLNNNDVSTPGPGFYVNHVTVYNSSVIDKNIYPKEIDGAIVKNCIVSQSEPTEATPVRIYDTNCIAENILF